MKLLAMLALDVYLFDGARFDAEILFVDYPSASGGALNFSMQIGLLHVLSDRCTGVAFG